MVKNELKFENFKLEIGAQTTEMKEHFDIKKGEEGETTILILKEKKEASEIIISSSKWKKKKKFISNINPTFPEPRKPVITVAGALVSTSTEAETASEAAS